MEKINSEIDIITKHCFVKGRNIIDVGCGVGKLVRLLTQLEANVIGVDIPELIEKARLEEKTGNEKYIVGTGEQIPVENESADLIIFFASFHHVPENQMDKALSEACRALIKGGTLLFVEPVPVPGSYTEIIKLADDESEIQKTAYEYISEADKKFGLYNELERFYFLERTFDDYKKLIGIYIMDEEKRNSVTQSAIKKMAEMGKEPETAVFQAIVRLNLFTKL